MEKNKKIKTKKFVFMTSKHQFVLVVDKQTNMG
jgi:hypothetical protein